MYPFWKIAIEPIIRAADARRVVEIGALRGDTTARMLDGLGADAEFHVIDPVPDFDPSAHERRFPGRYVFHRDISHNVLPHLPPMDVALVDGDHNWYTVYHELKMLADVARKADEPLPVLVMHDVLWPYGRRDLYYTPERVPAEFRQPHEQRGMRPGRSQLLPKGGLSPTLDNATVEGGERNGVMTALDDFMKEYDRPLRRVVLPIYFGLAIVVEQEQLDRHPKLEEVLDWLEGAEGRGELLELAESLRLESLLTYHNMFYGQDPRLERRAKRYLDLLKGSLLNEHYLENEARLKYLVSCATNERQPEPAKLRDPMRTMAKEMERLVNARRTGAAGHERGEAASLLPFTDMGRQRLDHLELCLDTMRRENIAGDLVECGTGRGGGAIFLRGYLEAHELSARAVWVASRFMVSDDADPKRLLAVSTDINVVREGFDRFHLLDEQVHFLQGPPEETLTDAPIEQVALVRIGGGLGSKTGVTLNRIYRRISIGGFVVVDDYATSQCQTAVDTFRERHGITDPIERIDGAGVFWRKTHEPVTVSSDTASRAARFARRIFLKPTHTPRQPPSPRRAKARPVAPAGSKDLSVVVVFYNMRREAQRTLHSLSRAYQRDIEGLDYEVIAVDNGSSPEQRLTEEFVQSFGPEFRLLDLADDATPSPADALNRGASIAAGTTIAFMIDGAHVVTPGVLHYGMAGIDAYAPSIVATQLWYLGPGQQPDTGRHGYDQTYEDKLLKKIQWPLDGYRLFEIGHFIGDRDWFDTLWESNCLFVPRSLLEQSGCYDESFSAPGGGFANLDFFERIASTPGVNLTTLLGEGSFHQFHGGTTTNTSDTSGRRASILTFGQQYGELRGRMYRHPNKRIHYFGTMVPAALRTRARQMSAPSLPGGRDDDVTDGIPTQPAIIPDELKWSFIDAFWHSLAWRQATWLGTKLDKAPTDLFAYQELIERVRPDWIIETGTGTGGRALFLASVCELLSHGQVVSIDQDASADRPSHPRITYLTGTAHAPETVERVRELTGGQCTLVVLGSWLGLEQTRAEFDAYEPFVQTGSYVVVEGTIVNGHPVWPTFGRGPAEAVRGILQRHEDFVADEDAERYGLTFNRGGFLRRT